MITRNGATGQPRLVVFDICIATKKKKKTCIEKPRTMWCGLKVEKQFAFKDRTEREKGEGR